MRILSAAEMREVDELTSERYGISSMTLMENAGSGIAAHCVSRLNSPASAQILIVCGKGNNGGDGLVAARYLIQYGMSPHVVLLTSYEHVKGDAKPNLDALIQTGLRPRSITTIEEWVEYASSMSSLDLVVDAILGTGLTQPVEGFLSQVIEDMNQRFSSKKVLAVDLPSGLNADSHEMMGPVIHAHTTLTMTAPKVCLAFPPAAETAGEIHVIAIGSPDSLIEERSRLNLSWLTETDCRFVVAPRPLGSNKGAYGHVLIIAGSVGKTGAAALAGRSALRAGAGLVTVATAASAQPLVAQSMPELMTIPLAETRAGSVDLACFDYGVLDNALLGKRVLAIGPGMSMYPDTQEFIRRVVARYRLPMILDADAVNAFADHTAGLDGEGRTLILTPHPGEFARLIRSTPQIVQSDRRDFAREFATRHHVILVLKGFRTIVATPEGEIFVSPTGNPGMAKGGSGDALTGIMAGLLAQFSKAPPARVAAAAVFLHGRAGDYARKRFGEMAMLAGDMIDCLPEVLQDLARSTTTLSDHPTL
jgi:ADP-dependent NAD(P)H-hydrate dehydratase / NAD(P)H-hydrate epimerase